MRPQLIMFLFFVVLIGNLMCAMLDGLWFGSEDVGFVNYLTGYNTLQLGGFWGVVVGGIGFFTHGLPMLLTWNFSFLSGSLGILRFILFTFSAGVTYGIVELFIPALPNVISRR